MNEASEIEAFIGLVLLGKHGLIQSALERARPHSKDLILARSQADGHFTAFGAAILFGRRDCLTLFLQEGIERDIYACCILDDLAGIEKMLNNAPYLINSRSPATQCASLLEIPISEEVLDLLERKGAVVDLCCCARHGLLEKAHFLLTSNRSSINCRNHLGETPIHVSLKWKEYDIAKMLLNADVDINAVNYSGETISMLASDAPVEVVLGILSKKPRLDLISANQFGALEYAALKGRLDIVRLLVENGAKLARSTEWEKSTLFEALTKAKKIEILDFLTKRLCNG